MPLIRARKDLANAQAEILHLRIEVNRLREALTDAKLLATLLAPPPVPPPHLPHLSPREVDVLARLIEGDSNAEIAKRLFIGETTVKHHLWDLSKKFKSHNRIGTASAAIRDGFVAPDQEDQP